MKTTYIGQEKYLVRGSNLYRIAEASEDAIVQTEWAGKVLSVPAVTWANGKNSHEVANEILEKCEDVLIDYQVFTV